MTLIEVIDAARVLVKDRLPSSRSFPDDSSGFLRDTEMTTWFNMAQHEIQNKLIQTFEHWFVTSTSINVVKDTDEYSLPSDFIKAVRLEDIEVTSAPIEVFPLSLNDKDGHRFGIHHGVTSHGDISNYVIKGDSVIVRPVPSRSVTNKLKLFYIKRIPEYNSASSISIIPAEYHETLVFALVKKAMIHLEATPEAMTIAASEFNRLVREMERTAENRQVQRSRQVKRRKFARR